MRVLIINASHRAGNTDLIIKKLKNLLNNHQVDELTLRDIDMKMPDGCADCADSLPCPHIEDDFAKTIETTLHDYELYVLATPTWSDNVTPLTLVFWNRIVSWCHDDRKYLKGKKLAIITHGMADNTSWANVISWVKSVCNWEECKFAGSFTCQSGSKMGEIAIDQMQLENFAKEITS